jgi:hypothetical protein
MPDTTYELELKDGRVVRITTDGRPPSDGDVATYLLNTPGTPENRLMTQYLSQRQQRLATGAIHSGPEQSETPTWIQRFTTAAEPLVHPQSVLDFAGLAIPDTAAALSALKPYLGLAVQAAKEGSAIGAPARAVRATFGQWFNPSTLGEMRGLVQDWQGLLNAPADAAKVARTTNAPVWDQFLTETAKAGATDARLTPAQAFDQAAGTLQARIPTTGTVFPEGMQVRPFDAMDQTRVRFLTQYGLSPDAATRTVNNLKVLEARAAAAPPPPMPRTPTTPFQAPTFTPQSVGPTEEQVAAYRASQANKPMPTTARMATSPSQIQITPPQPGQLVITPEQATMAEQQLRNRQFIAKQMGTASAAEGKQAWDDYKAWLATQQKP